jgi:hypothetical protein
MTTRDAADQSLRTPRAATAEYDGTEYAAFPVDYSVFVNAWCVN